MNNTYPWTYAPSVLLVYRIRTPIVVVCALTTVVAFSALLVHVLLGNKNTWIAWNSYLILLSGLCLLVFGISQLAFFYRNFDTDSYCIELYTEYHRLVGFDCNFFNWGDILGLGLSEGFQAIVHFLLSVKYR